VEYYTRRRKRQQRNWVHRRGAPLGIDFWRSAAVGQAARSDQPNNTSHHSDDNLLSGSRQELTLILDFHSVTC